MTVPDRPLAHGSPLLLERLGLVDAVDTLLNRGVLIQGDATISLAGVDLIYLKLQLLLSSVETIERSRGGPPGRGSPAGRPRLPGGGSPAAAPALRESNGGRSAVAGMALALAEPAGEALAEREAGPPAEGRPERGLAQLVLTLVELLRRVLERQAVRRLEGEGLTDAEIERMGRALMELEAKMVELRTAFDLTEADLDLDLGPLGRLL